MPILLPMYIYTAQLTYLDNVPKQRRLRKQGTRLTRLTSTLQLVPYHTQMQANGTHVPLYTGECASLAGSQQLKQPVYLHRFGCSSFWIVYLSVTARTVLLKVEKPKTLTLLVVLANKHTNMHVNILENNTVRRMPAN